MYKSNLIGLIIYRLQLFTGLIGGVENANLKIDNTLLYLSLVV